MMLFFRQTDIFELVASQGLSEFNKALVSRLESAFQNAAAGHYRSPNRDGFATASGDDPSLVEWMPAAYSDGNAGLKLVGYHPSNPERWNLPTVLSTTVLFDNNTGAVKSIFESTTLTCLRTAAASALASRHLASPESKTLGIIGCGTQAVGQVHAILLQFPVDRVLFHDTDQAATRSFPYRLHLHGSPIELEPATPESIANRSDIICTQTTIRPGSPPVLPTTVLKPHCHINAVGSDFPGKREIPLEILSAALVVPDHRQQALLEGECQALAPEALGPDLAELCACPEKWLDHQRKLTVFDSTGCALEDLVTAQFIEELARQQGIGEEIEFCHPPADPKDPYASIFNLAPAAAALPTIPTGQA